MKYIPTFVGVSLFIGMLVGLVPNGSSAQENHAPPFTKKNVSPVRVAIIDSATNGCWTNLNEAKDYAEGQLGLAGIEVTNEFAARTYLALKVNSERKQNGLCFGSISLELHGWVSWDEGRAYVTLTERGADFGNAKNVNVDILDMIKEFSIQFFVTLPDGD